MREHTAKKAVEKARAALAEKKRIAEGGGGGQEDDGYRDIKGRFS